jgi:hypothetical protein
MRPEHRTKKRCREHRNTTEDLPTPPEHETRKQKIRNNRTERELKKCTKYSNAQLLGTAPRISPTRGEALGDE